MASRRRTYGTAHHHLAAGILCLLLAVPLASVWAQTATGVVFDDANANGARDGDEPGIAGVGVSNGTEVTTTDEQGRWTLPCDDDCILFVIKPTGWAVPLSEDNVPRFYTIHKPDGSPQMKYDGVAPTGPLPASVDFALRRSEEPGEFRALLIGDTQVSNVEEIQYLCHDVLEGIATGEDEASLAFSLGDNANNVPDLFGRISGAMACLGMPVYYVNGNHDRNYDSPGAPHDVATFNRHFGPADYSLNYGGVHFIVLNDVVTTEGANYAGGFNDEQLAFVENDLALVPNDTLVVYMMHIPMVENIRRRADFFALFEGRENVFGVSAHWHKQSHWSMGPDQGWPNEQRHHHLVNVTACGAWWGGKLDYYGLPDTTMSDGVPNGYTVLHCSGNTYRTEYVPSRLPRRYQMRIWTPEVVAADEAGKTRVYVNVFAGSERSTVEMRVGDGADWVALDRVPNPRKEDVEAYKAAFAERVAKRQKYDGEYQLAGLEPSPHLWAGTLPEGMQPGYHWVRVRTTDMYGTQYEAVRLFEVQ